VHGTDDRPEADAIDEFQSGREPMAAQRQDSATDSLPCLENEEIDAAVMQDARLLESCYARVDDGDVYGSGSHVR
jgi:hypothetical protein